MEYEERRKELEGKIRQCVADARSAMGQGAPTYDHAIAELHGVIGLLNDLGNQQIADAHEELTRNTAELTKATRRLQIATWVLFLATIALFLATVYEVIR